MPASTEAENADRMFRLLVQGVTDYAIYMLDPNGIVINWNAGAQRAKGYTAEEIIGQHFSRFYGEEDLHAGLPCRVLEEARTKGRFEGEGWRIRKDGTRFWAHVIVDRIRNEDGSLIGYAKITRDLTERKHHADRIAYLAHHDVLTDLPNRVTLQHQLGSILQRTAADRACAVLFLDLDEFKPVNDLLGHAAGDDLLRAVAQRIQGVLRGPDLVARLGGDEFVILQQDTSVKETTALAERVLRTLNLPFVIKDTQVSIGVSIGISMSFQDTDTPDALLHNADLALYRAKGDGKNCCRFYDPQMDAYARQRRELERDLRAAVAARQFELHYQPIVDLQCNADLERNALIGFEALLRWGRPDYGPVSPVDFIPCVEKLGLMPELGNWILETACREAARWPHALFVAVNVSPTQLRDPKLFERLQAILKETGLAPELLELEITETNIIQDVEGASAVLERLRASDIRIALDDFGTGYSSLSFLHSLPFSRIKIDRSFIQNVGEDRQSTAIVQAITGLCNRLGVDVTAEGVETEQQAALLRDESSIQAQGYWFSRPRPAREIPALIEGFPRKQSITLQQTETTCSLIEA